MKKAKKILLLFILIIIALMIRVYAVSNIIKIDGSETAKTGEDGTVTVVLISDNFRGLTGKIEKSSNITIKSVTAVNGDWTVNYNSDNGAFNIYGGTGTSLMEITYTGTEGAGNITLTNMEMSDNEYNTAEVDYVIKPIQVSDISEENKESDNSTNGNEQTNSEYPSNTTEEPKSENEDKSKNTSGAGTKQETTKETKTTQAKKDSTTANKTLAYTGIGRGMIAIGTIIAIIGGVALYRYRLYRKI